VALAEGPSAESAPDHPEHPPASSLQSPAPGTGLLGSLWNLWDRANDIVEQVQDTLSPDRRRFRYGAPPASKSVVTALPDIDIGAAEVSVQAHCGVCLVDWELGERATSLPCAHCFHRECLRPWLAQRNSCPLCRYELPTDNASYERYRKRRDVASHDS